MPILILVSSVVMPLFLLASSVVQPLFILASSVVLPIFILASSVVQPLFLLASSVVLPVLILASSVVMPILILASSVVMPIFILASSVVQPLFILASSVVLPLFFLASSGGGGDFGDSESRKQIKFNDSIFHNMSFDNMEFKGPAYFDNVTFEETVSFVRSIFHDYSNFEKAKFLKEAIFKHALFKEWTYFRNVSFNGKTSFAGTISKEKILIEATNLSNMFFAETNIESFKFLECEWDKGEDGINLVYDEVKQDELETKNSTLEEIYRRLKKVARENADEEQTSAWHYKEKEMKKREADSAFFFPAIITTFLTFIAFLICCGLLESTAPLFPLIVLIPTALAIPCFLIQNQNKKFKLKYKYVPKSKNWFSKIYLNIYYWISGYGENPLRAGVLFVVLVSLPFMINFFTGFKDGADWVKHAMWYMPLLKVNFPKSASFEGLQYFWKGVSVSLITIQAALFAFALRNKLRR